MRRPSNFLIIIAFILGNILVANAQQNYTITDFNKLIENNSTQTRSQQNFDSEEIEKLQNLVFELNPMLIFKGNEHKKMGEGDAQLVIIESSNLPQLHSISNEMQSVVLILIKHSSINNPSMLDLNSIKSSSLKYVLIECDFECSASNLQNILKNTSNVKVLYRITSEQ